MKSVRKMLAGVLCCLVFAMALPLPASPLAAADLSAGQQPPGLFPATAPDTPLAVFDPITHTILPGGNYH